MSPPACRVGTVVVNSQPGMAAALTDFAHLVEDAGFASLWVTDHVVAAKEYTPYYGEAWLEPLTLLGSLAALTTRIRLGIGVLVAPYRDPVLAGRAIATVDALSGGRMTVGVGTGWSRREFAALGVGELFEPRGRVTDEALDLMRRVWAGGPIEHRGEFFAVDEVSCEPTVQAPGPPIWIGGQSKRALRRAAAYADVWHPHDIDPGQLHADGERLDELAGRAIPRSVRIHPKPGQVEELAELVASYAAVGCEEVVVEFPSQPVTATRRLTEAAAEALFG